MGGFVIGGLLVLVVLALSAAVYRWGMARTSELLETLEPEEPESLDEAELDEVAEIELPEIGSHARAPEPTSRRSTAERLAELDELLGKGLITPAEHHEQRTVILRSI